MSCSFPECKDERLEEAKEYIKEEMGKRWTSTRESNFSLLAE